MFRLPDSYDNTKRHLINVRNLNESIYSKCTEVQKALSRKNLKN